MCSEEKLSREGFSILNRVREALTGVTFEQEPEGGRGMSHVLSGVTMARQKEQQRQKPWGSNMPTGCHISKARVAGEE